MKNELIPVNTQIEEVGLADSEPPPHFHWYDQPANAIDGPHNGRSVDDDHLRTNVFAGTGHSWRYTLMDAALRVRVPDAPMLRSWDHHLNRPFSGSFVPQSLNVIQECAKPPKQRGTDRRFGLSGT